MRNDERMKFEESEIYAVKSGLHEESTPRIYLVSLHMGVSNLVGSSFVEFKKISDADKMIRCLLLIFGTGYMIYLIVIVLQFTQSLAKPELKYQEIMHEVEEYIRDKKLPARLKQKLIDYYEYRFQGNYFKENAIFHALSSHLRQEITVRLSRGSLETASIFQNLPRNLLSSIMASLKPAIYLQDDVIYKCGMDGDCMYFIASGTVAVINYLGVEICHLKDGNYFGEILLIYPERRRNVTVIALEVCEFLRLERPDFKRLVTPETELYERLVSVATERLDHTKTIDELSERKEKARQRRNPGYSEVLSSAQKIRAGSLSNENVNAPSSSSRHAKPSRRYFRNSDFSNRD
ncbi:potassium/sodium hyperpolarization-activated cyclic nucleotide-gated channel 1-like [Venturia canescens]|uniref:potassium/sodium hyperpolarization-activated cyclic nucleotide-gated channel 1-like n=1 Tax=Venturia canescens TaxID=32260 RepID=UPI001C9CA286|nr:potassium/sodium hyperpolarization-activated cyclic nucleotide-gated channel 1-like [Venturia canescens]